MSARLLATFFLARGAWGLTAALLAYRPAAAFTPEDPYAYYRATAEYVLGAAACSAATLGAVLLWWLHPAARYALTLYLLLRGAQGTSHLSLGPGLADLTGLGLALSLLWWGIEVGAVFISANLLVAPARPAPDPAGITCPTCDASLAPVEQGYTAWGLVERLFACPTCKVTVRRVGWKGADSTRLFLRLLRAAALHGVVAAALLFWIVLLVALILLGVLLRPLSFGAQAMGDDAARRWEAPPPPGRLRGASLYDDLRG